MFGTDLLIVGTGVGAVVVLGGLAFSALAVLGWLSKEVIVEADEDATASI